MCTRRLNTHLKKKKNHWPKLITFCLKLEFILGTRYSNQKVILSNKLKNIFIHCECRRNLFNFKIIFEKEWIKSFTCLKKNSDKN